MVSLLKRLRELDSELSSSSSSEDEEPINKTPKLSASSINIGSKSSIITKLKSITSSTPKADDVTTNQSFRYDHHDEPEEEQEDHTTLAASFCPNIQNQDFNIVQQPKKRLSNSSLSSSLPPTSNSLLAENVAATTTTSADIVELKNMIAVVVEQNKSLLERVSKLEEKFAEKENNKEEPIPNDVRFHVKKGYNEKEKRGDDWKLEGNIGPFHDDNLNITKFIRTYVTALHPELENRDIVINRAIRKYYESKYTVFRKKRSNPGLVKSNAKHQRKIHKAERRRKTLAQMSIFDKDDKENLTKAVVPEMMSSEDEKEDENGERYFEVHIPLFRTKKYNKLISAIDKTYKENCSKRSKEQMIRRVRGETSCREAPSKLKFGFDIFVKKDN